MRIDIHPIKLGVGHCYVVRGDRTIMIDAGSPRQATRFRKAIDTLAIDPRSIRLIVITHGHWDHIGSAGAIRALTGAQIAMHHRETDWLEKPIKTLAPAVTPWGHIFRAIMTTFLPLVRLPAADVDIVVGNEGASLAGYGIPGRIVYTPGHSRGSVSVLLETGDAFVGDLAMERLSASPPSGPADLRRRHREGERQLETSAG